MDFPTGVCKNRCQKNLTHSQWIDLETPLIYVHRRYLRPRIARAHLLEQEPQRIRRFLRDEIRPGEVEDVQHSMLPEVLHGFWRHPAQSMPEDFL